MGSTQSAHVAGTSKPIRGTNLDQGSESEKRLLNVQAMFDFNSTQPLPWRTNALPKGKGHVSLSCQFAVVGKIVMSC